MSATATTPEPEPLMTAKIIRDQTAIPTGTIYLMARKKMIRSYRVGIKRGGVRFKLSEVLAALETTP